MTTTQGSSSNPTAVGHRSRLVVVIGMHRSGTSALTKGINALGVELGEDLMPQVEGNNPKGFFEDKGVNQLNVRLLRHLDRDWDSFQPMPTDESTRDGLSRFRIEALDLLKGKLASFPAFGLKDPRLTRLMPFWSDVFRTVADQPALVIALRNPIAVAQSLQRRDGFSRVKSYYLWLAHMLDAYRAAVDSGFACIVVDYDELLDNPVDQLQRVARALELDGTPDVGGISEFASGFLDESLRHSRFSPSDMDMDPLAPREVKAVFEAFAAAAKEDGKVSASAQSQMLEQYYRKWLELSPLLEYSSHLDRDLRSSRSRIRTLEVAHQKQTADVQRLELENRDLRIASDARDSQLEDLAERVTRHARSEAESRASREREMQALRQEREALASDVTNARSEIQEQGNRIQSLLSREGELRAELERASALLSEERTAADRLKQTIQSLESESLSFHEAQSRTVRELADLTRQLLALQDRETRRIRDRAELVDLLKQLAPARSVSGRLLNGILRPLVDLAAACISGDARRRWLERRIVSRSELFDATWYIERYPDVLVSRMDPVDHFVRFGSLERRSPGPEFDAAQYLRDNPDVAAAGLNPLAHFEHHGRKEGRNVTPPKSGR